MKILNYEMRLTTRKLISLERALGKAPIMVLMDFQEKGFPNIEDIATIIHHSVVDTKLDGYDVLDKFIGEGHTYMDIVPIIIELFQECGYLPKPDEEIDEEEKN